MVPAGLISSRRAAGLLCKFVGPIAPVFLLALFLFIPTAAQNQFEDRSISEVTVTFEGSDKNVNANETFRLIAVETLGANYSSVRVRDAIEKLYGTKQVASVIVEASETSGGVAVRFVVRRKTQAQRVVVELPEDDDSKITEQELLFRLNLLDPGTAVTEQSLQQNA